MKKKSKYAKKRRSGGGSPFVWILASVAIVLLVLIIAMLLMIPKMARKDQAPVPTTEIPATQTTAETASATAEAATQPTAQTETTAPIEATEPQMIPRLAQLYAENPDIAGWITIPDTVVDYPVMFTPEDPEKYLRTNFEGKFEVAGLPFVDGSCSMDPESDNLIIYGHNMNNGTMFRTLMKYEQKNYWEEHPTITFSTLYEERTYEIIAAFYDRVYYTHENVFKFYKFIDAEDEADFAYAMENYKEKALYDTGVTAEFGDNLITLVTCAYHTDNGRFVVVAKQVEP